MIGRPIPEIFVLWHPQCALGEFLARQVYRWVRPGGGLGPKVYFRSLPAPESPAGGLPPPLPGERRAGTQMTAKGCRVSNLQVVLVLIDENMVADPAWRHWLVQLATPAGPTEPGMDEGMGPDERVLAPVALDSTAFNVPGALRELNFLRPTGLPVPVGAGAASARDEVARSLLKQLTEAFCTLFFGRRATPGRVGFERAGAAPKIKIFLSHAKADGTTPAKRLRDYIYSQTQLAAFYDENDIPFGTTFGRVLDQDLEAEETAAMVAVRTAAYATRPWCRRELALFRRPRCESGQEGQASEHWRLNPAVIVEAMGPGEQTLGIPEMGNAPMIRWAEGVERQEERVITTVLRDVLLSAYHLAVGRMIPVEGDQVILNWVPDPTTLLWIPRVREGRELKVFYPGRGLSGLELDILDDSFPNLEFRSFEEVIS